MNGGPTDPGPISSSPVSPGAVEGLLQRHVGAGADPDQRILLQGGSVVSMDPAIGDLARGDVLIVGDRIAAVGEGLSTDGAVVVDARDRIVIPGFCDPHIHCWEGVLGRIIPENVPQTTDDPVAGAPVSSRSYMYAAHRLFGPACRPEDVYVGTLLTLLNALDAGITTVVDNMHNARSPEHSDAAVAALMDSGLRGVHAVGKPLYGDWAGSFPSDVSRLREQYFAGDDQLCTLRLFAIGVDDLTELVRLRRELDLWFSFDTGVFKQDLQQLYKDGSFDGREAINHGNFFTAEQRQLIVDNGSQVNVCPRIESQFRYGRIPYNEWVEQGLRPGISNDNPMTYGIDMFSEMRALYMLQRVDEHRYGAESASLREVLESATQRSADNCGVGRIAGSLTPGKKADLVLLDATRPQLYPRNNVLCSVVESADIGCVDAVLVNGRIVKWGGELLGVDRDRIRRLADESHEYLLRTVEWPHDAVDFDD